MPMENAFSFFMRGYRDLTASRKSTRHSKTDPPEKDSTLHFKPGKNTWAVDLRQKLRRGSIDGETRSSRSTSEHHRWHSCWFGDPVTSRAAKQDLLGRTERQHN